MHPVEQAVRQWLEDVVIGLNLCPFAALPLRNDRLQLRVSEAPDEAALYDELRAALYDLDDTTAAQLDTLIIAIPKLLGSFEDYNRFLEQADQLLRRQGWQGVYQIASFHPHYRFEGSPADDVANYTNRSPYPLLHVLREDSVAAAVARHPDADGIPDRNIQTMRALSTDGLRRLFGGDVQQGRC